MDIYLFYTTPDTSGASTTQLHCYKFTDAVDKQDAVNRFAAKHPDYKYRYALTVDEYFAVFRAAFECVVFAADGGDANDV